MTVRVPLTATGPLTEATFVARPNQLLVEAHVNGKLVRAYMADRKRLVDLLLPGTRLLLEPRDELGRKSTLQVAAIYSGDELVALDTQLASRLVVAALASGALPQFARYTRIQRDATVGTYHFDFRLGEGRNTCMLDVKTVSKVVDGLARFPDLHSERGSHNLDVLSQMARSDQRCAVLFLIQRQAAQALVPDEELDPAFSRALRQAITCGVETYAYLCPSSHEGITLGAPVPIFSSPEAIPHSKWVN